MKFNVLHIIKDHVSTLRSADGKGVSYLDIFLFFVSPALISVLMVYLDVSITDGVYGVSVSIFSIFSALLLNVQIAIFGIFQREWRMTGDSISDAEIKEKYKLRRILLSEVNTNISYLIVVSCFSVTVFLILYIISFENFVELAVSVYLYVHFVINLMMVVKRSHALFNNEYALDGVINKESE